MATCESLESYPPLFRHTKSTIVTEPLPAAEDSDPLPVVDLQSMDLVKLRESCAAWGAFRLVNHGIPVGLLSQLQEQTKNVFELPFETKESTLKSPISYFWGAPVVAPSVPGGKASVDWVEGFNVPLSQLPLLQPHDPTLLSFRDVVEEYGRHLSRIARTMFHGMAEDLKLDPKLSKSQLAESTGLVRFQRYPPCTDPDQTLGFRAHTDSPLLTILLQDQVEGLQVLKDDTWITLKPIPNTLIVHVGDMMQAMSDDAYKSVTHRVKVNGNVERISIAYFVSPVQDFVIQSSKYRPFSYNDYMAQLGQDVKTVGSKVGLSRFVVA